MITGLNHITLAVSEFERFFRFYTEALGFAPKAKWARGAYLSVGGVWFCLSLDDKCRVGAFPEYSHIAFSVSANDFESFSNALIDKEIPVWKPNASEGDSLYILDPDGHKLEIHVGSLDTRLDSLRESPYDGLVLFA